MKEHIKNKIVGLGCLTALVAGVGGAIFGIKSCNDYIGSHSVPDVWKDMKIGEYKIVAYSGMTRSLRFYREDDTRPMLVAYDDDYYPDTTRPRFDVIDMSLRMPYGDTLEKYVRLDKLEELHAYVMKYGKKE